jgi:hypothetical protein
VKLLCALGYEPSRDFHLSPREAASIVGIPYRAGCNSLLEEVSRGRLRAFHALPGLPRVMFSDLTAWYETHSENINIHPRSRKNLRRPLLWLPETDWRWRQRRRLFASLCVNHALKIGLLERGRCVQCNKPGAHAHHPHYDKPLLIRWLCSSHHSSLHSSRRDRFDSSRREELRLARQEERQLTGQGQAEQLLPPERPLSKEELCEWLHCHPKYIEAQVAQGLLRPHKLSKRMVRFAWSEVDQWMSTKVV